MNAVYVILILLTPLLLLFGLGWVFEKVWKFITGAESNMTSSIPENHIEYLLQSRFNYYKNLSPYLREKFIQRLVNFMEAKDFSGRKGLAVTDEMRIMISASAVQVT